MTIRGFIKAYFSSPLGTGGLAVSVVSLFVAGFSGSWLLGLLLCGSLFAASTAIGFFTLRGVRTVLRQEESKRWSDTEAELVKIEALVKNLKSLRIADTRLSGIVYQVCMRADKYLAACRKNKTHDPVTSENLEHVPELVDALLSELDETAIEKRFQLEDQHEFPLARDRVCAELERVGRLAEKSALDIDGSLLPSEYVETRETL